MLSFVRVHAHAHKCEEVLSLGQLPILIVNCQLVYIRRGLQRCCSIRKAMRRPHDVERQQSNPRFFLYTMPPNTMTNKEYFIGFQTNDQQVITSFYEKFQPNFKRSLISKYTILDDEFLADVYQDTVIRLWENIQRGRITLDNLTSDLTGYLFGIGENVLREQLRKKKEILIEDLPESPDPANDILQDEIKEVVEAMDTPCAPLLLKFYWEGYSMDEIAIQLGYANANSAKTQKNKCMNKLKAIFKSL